MHPKVLAFLFVWMHSTLSLLTAGQNTVNVATAAGRTCTMSTTYNNDDLSCSAANGNTSGEYLHGRDYPDSNCIHTSDAGAGNPSVTADREPWFEVDLGRMSFVSSVKVWGRSGFERRLYPFNITVDGVYCGEASPNPVTREHTVTCGSGLWGRKVRLTRGRKDGDDFSLNLCEMEVHKCLDGYYREGSSNSSAPCSPCPGRCGGDAPCDKATGDCDQCPDGKKGKRCQQDCDDNHYGPSRCSLPCGQCEHNAPCHPVTGHCPRCQPGWYLPLCQAVCIKGTYGHYCSQSCGQCQGGQQCATETGECTEGCAPGWTGLLCKEECQPGFYGKGCVSKCRNCQVNTTCHRESGECPKGCAEGYGGKICMQATEEHEGASFVVPVLGGTFPLLSAAVIVIIIFFIVRRRRSTGEAGVKVNAEPAQGVDSLHMAAVSAAVGGSPPQPGPQGEGHYEIVDEENHYEIVKEEEPKDEVAKDEDTNDKVASEEEDYDDVVVGEQHHGEVVKDEKETPYENATQQNNVYDPLQASCDQGATYSRPTFRDKPDVK